MRDINKFQPEGGIGFAHGLEVESNVSPENADQLAIVWTSGTDLLAASPDTKAGTGMFDIDVARFPANISLAPAINMRRSHDLGLPKLSPDTRYLTAVADYSERTRILALDGQRLALNDNDLLDWLINAEKQMQLGTDGHPLFETPLDETACSICRLPNGQISITEVPRQYVRTLLSRVHSVSGEPQSTPLDITIETPLRCAARYFLTATKEGKEILRPGKAAEVTAFLVINNAGYSFGLWSPQTGLFSEYAFLSPDEVSHTRRGRRPDPSTTLSPETAVEEYVRQAFDELLVHMSPDKLGGFQLLTYAQVVWAAEPGLLEIATQIADEREARSGIEFCALEISPDEAVARGLILGSYSFGEISAAGASVVPPVDIARDLLTLADTEAMERFRKEEARLQVRRNRALVSILAAPVIVVACLLALAASTVGAHFLTSIRESRADARTAELKPALERRRSYEANLKWYQEFVSEVSQLRRQQPVGLGLLYQLNSNYPFNIDPAFYVSDMKLSAAGDVEMKGMARSKDAVASFLKALEFSSGPESGTRLFSNLAYEVQEVAPQMVAAGQVTAPTLTGSTLTTPNATAPGVVIWSIRGNYLPMAEFVPKQAAAAQTGTAAKPAPVTTATDISPTK